MRLDWKNRKMPYRARDEAFKYHFISLGFRFSFVFNMHFKYEYEFIVVRCGCSLNRTRLSTNVTRIKQEVHINLTVTNEYDKMAICNARAKGKTCGACKRRFHFVPIFSIDITTNPPCSCGHTHTTTITLNTLCSATVLMGSDAVVEGAWRG